LSKDVVCKCLQIATLDSGQGQIVQVQMLARWHNDTYG